MLGVISEAESAVVSTAGKAPSSGYPDSSEEREIINKSPKAKPHDTSRDMDVVSII